MGSSNLFKHILKDKKLVLCLSIAIVLVLIFGLSFLCKEEEDVDYTEWQKMYDTLPEQVDYDKYSKISECLADVAIGINVSDTDIEMLRNALPEKNFKEIEVTLNNERIGDVEQTEKSVEEQMDEIVGGKSDSSDSKYKMGVLTCNYYHPDVYVYKMVNKNNNCVIVTIYTNNDGGIDNVKTSL